MAPSNIFDGDSYHAIFARLIYKRLQSRKWFTYADIMAEYMMLGIAKNLSCNVSNCDNYGELKKAFRYVRNAIKLKIGDGYFEEPYRVDPYYVGEARGWGLFFMGTDVGYIRFLYYFGCLGLFSFMFYFIRITKESIADFPKEKWVFLALLFINFTIWLKVATDIFCLFALFLCISKEDNDTYEKIYEDSISDQLDI